MDPQSPSVDEDVFDYYVSPTDALQRDRVLAEREARESVAALFWTWERLRIVYNASLFVVVLLLGFRWLIAGDAVFYVTCVMGAFGANVCYCTGFPLVIYAQRLGINGRGMVLVLFGMGLLLSVGITGGVCLAYAQKGF